VFLARNKPKGGETGKGNQFVHILTPTGKISQDSYGSMTNESVANVVRMGKWEMGKW